MKEPEYFSVCSRRVLRPLTVLGLPRAYYGSMSQKRFEQLEPAVAGYFSHEARQEVPAVLHEPTFLVSDVLKRLFELYDTSIQAKAVQLISAEPEHDVRYLYWALAVPALHCLHESSVRYADGTVRIPRLDGAAVQSAPLFSIAELAEYRLIVELTVAESILRRCPYGVDLIPVEVVQHGRS